MQVLPVYTGSSLFDKVQLKSSNSVVSKISSAEIQKDFNNFEKFVNQNLKTSAATENLSSSKNVVEYNFHIQIDTPLSSSERINKSFNNSNRIQNIKSYKRTINDSDYYSSLNSSEPKKGSGYYIIVNSPADSFKQNRTKNFTSEIQNRINKTYHLGFRRDPGTLVDLVY